MLFYKVIPKEMKRPFYNLETIVAKGKVNSIDLTKLPAHCKKYMLCLTLVRHFFQRGFDAR